MNEHPQFDEDFDLYVLGVLDGDEKESIELHLAHCDECARRIERASGGMALVAFSAPPKAPRPEVRERLLRRVRIHPGTRWSSATLLRRILVWAAPAFGLATLLLAIAYVRAQRESRTLADRVHQLEAEQGHLLEQSARARAVLDLLIAPETLKVTLVKAGATPAAEGKAFYSPQKGLVFYAANMRPLSAAEKTYELWVIPRQGNPIPAGTFNPDAKGNGEVLLPALPSGIPAKAFAVTVEPAGGRPAPTSAPVLVGAVS